MISVLLPVDGSDSSARAVQAVITLYQRLAPVEVRLLHVQIADDVPEHALGGTPGAGQDARESGELALRAAEAMLARANVPCTSDRREGYVPSAIVEYAKAMHCDGIVMGTRGMGSSGQVIGSIARQVISLAHVPVTLVK
jgi:nucleotide-binding universal stress UspA family protein